MDDLLRFAKARLGVKWCVSCLTLGEFVADSRRNMYASEKVLQMSYANYQYVVFLHLSSTRVQPSHSEARKLS